MAQTMTPAQIAKAEAVFASAAAAAEPQPDHTAEPVLAPLTDNEVARLADLRSLSRRVLNEKQASDMAALANRESIPPPPDPKKAPAFATATLGALVLAVEQLGALVPMAHSAADSLAAARKAYDAFVYHSSAPPK